jgi:aspartokinase
MTDRIVDKIGGSSMAWPLHAMEIARSTPDKRIVVVSAPGSDKVGDRPHRMTEMLKRYEETPDTQLLDDIKDRLFTIGRRGLLSTAAIERISSSVDNDIARAHDLGEPIDPLGETWMARLFADMLGSGWRYLPARDILTFNHGALDYDASTAALSQLDPALNYVVDGNQGGSPAGRLVRIGDGGSDASGAYIRRSLGQGILRIHSDVAGYRTVDPNLVSDEITLIDQQVPLVTYKEAKQLGDAGNGLVHRLVPHILQGSGSITELYSTQSGNNGTRLEDSRSNIEQQPIVGITGEKDVIKVVWSKQDSEDEVGATITFRKMPKKFVIPLHSTTTDDDLESVYTSGKHADKVQQAFRDNPEVSIKGSFSSVTIVGEGLSAGDGSLHRTRVLARASNALLEREIPVESMTSDGISTTFFVPQSSYIDAVASVHSAVIHPDTQL